MWLEDTGREGEKMNNKILYLSAFLPLSPPITSLSPLSSSPLLPPSPLSSPLQHADGESDEATVHCATCGVHVSVRKALGHMERCFMKVWWGRVPSVWEGGVFSVIDITLRLV